MDDHRTPDLCPSCGSQVSLYLADHRHDYRCPACREIVLFSRSDIGDVVVISLAPATGMLVVELDQVCQAIHTIIESVAPPPRIILDLRHVVFISENFIALAARILKELRPRSGVLKLCHANRTTQEVLELTRLTRVVHVCEDLQTALETITSEWSTDTYDGPGP